MMSKYETPPLIVIPITQTVLFPESTSEIQVNRSLGQLLIERIARGEDRALALSVKQGFERSDMDPNRFFSTGTLIRLKSFSSTNGHVLFRVHGCSRVAVQSIEKMDDHLLATVSPTPHDMDMDENSRKQMLKYLKDVFCEISTHFKESKTYVEQIRQMDSIPELMAHLLPFIQISLEEKQQLLETDSLKDRSIAFIDILIKHKASIQLEIELARKFSDQANKKHRKALLRERLRHIQEELNEDDSGSDGKKDYARLIREAGMPEDVEKTAMEELAKLNEQGQGSHETHIIKNYLDLLVALPWRITGQKEIDILHAAALLDAHHHGQKKVKERILQHLSVMKLKQEKQGSILLLVGPPGTGKTSLGAGIARALDRQYVRISLGGVRDEAEIRGHRRTYVGALPGRIIQGMKKAGEKNPVFVLDEVDKLVSSFHGDPSSALLEVLDPEQNNSFSDHYLEVPYDLSDVFFVATANDKRGIPAPLLDRMEVIELSGYTAGEKLCIARDHLMKRVLDDHGLDSSRLDITEDALKAIIDQYTVEAGVRALRQQLARVAGFASRKIVSGTADQPYTVTEASLQQILGHPKTRHDIAQMDNPPGVVTGLAWTPMGGEILFIEAVRMPGSGKLNLTGQLGDVMKESAVISMALFKSRLAFSLPDFNFDKEDLHIHIPAGALPKDGPSAGVVMFTAVTSLILRRKIDPKLAMTGEITLRGHILPVGGIKEKVLAAHRAGIGTVILPEENMKDLEDVPAEVKEQLRFVPVCTIEDLIRETIGIDLPGPETLSLGTLPEDIVSCPVL